MYPANTPKYTGQTTLRSDALVAEVKAQKDSPIIVNNESIFTMPGLGEITNDKCGMWVNALKCPNFQELINAKAFELDFKIHKHDRFVVQHRCHNPNCPICYPSWAKRVATKATDRLVNGRELYNKAGYKLGIFRHIIESPPQEYAIEQIKTLKGTKKLRKKARELMLEHGMRGGATVFHPFRQNKPYYYDSDGNKIANPKFNPEIIAWAWYPSPHFHIVGVGYLTNTDTFFKQTGWIYKTKKPRDPNEAISKQIQYMVGYQSSHAGITKGMQIVTYFGLFSYNKLSKSFIEKIRETIECRACGEALHSCGIMLDAEGNMDWKNAPDLGIFIRTRRKIIYKIRDSGRHGHCAGPEQNLPVYEEF